MPRVCCPNHPIDMNPLSNAATQSRKLLFLVVEHHEMEALLLRRGQNPRFFSCVAVLDAFVIRWTCKNLQADNPAGGYRLFVRTRKRDGGEKNDRRNCRKQFHFLPNDQEEPRLRLPRLLRSRRRDRHGRWLRRLVRLFSFFRWHILKFQRPEISEGANADVSTDPCE